jgi:hypothetical protein
LPYVMVVFRLTIITITGKTAPFEP